MPYIDSTNGRREALIKGDTALTPGELNFQIFYTVKYVKFDVEFYIRNCVKSFLGEKPNYQKYNDLIGCLVLCFTEINRRLKLQYNLLLEIIEDYEEEIAIYEDTKIIQNSDV